MTVAVQSYAEIADFRIGTFVEKLRDEDGIREP